MRYVESIDAPSVPRPVVVSMPFAAEIGARIEPQAVPWQRVLDAYLNSELDSPHSVAAYRGDCERALRRIGVWSLTELSGEVLSQYRAEVVADPSISPATKGRRLAALRAFLRWAGECAHAHQLSYELVIKGSLRSPKGSVVRPYQIVRGEDAERLWQAAASRPKTFAALCVWLGAGLRVAEVASLRIEHLYEDLNGHPGLRVAHGKGGKDRLLVIAPGYFQGIVAYLEATGRDLSCTGPVFVAEDRARASRGGGANGMTTCGLRVMLKKAEIEAGIDPRGKSPHALRHSFSMSVLRGGGGIVAVQKMLGHASIMTTQKYVDHLETEDLWEAIPKAGPPVAMAAPVKGLTTAEAATILGVTTNHVGYLCDKGTLVNTRAASGTSRNRWITAESVEALRAERAATDHSQGWNLRGHS